VRGNGIGQRLLRFIEDEARARGTVRFLLETGIRQSEALRLYERNGYVRCDPFGAYRPDPNSVFLTKAVHSQGERPAVKGDPDRFMRLALEEGRRALPGCLPNPPVGAVLVRGDEVIARGFTQPPGQPHAEVMAFAHAQGDLSDCVLYVTLEPCSFRGRTPSCAEALLARGVKVVCVAIPDPDSRNDGKGLERLRAAGVAVFVGTLAAEAQRDLGPYLNLPANRPEAP